MLVLREIVPVRTWGLTVVGAGTVGTCGIGNGVRLRDSVQRDALLVAGSEGSGSRDSGAGVEVRKLRRKDQE
ncbi:hypothetical protein TPCG7_08850 [Cutibacterium granulosum]|nr:hypothetical protein TPCG7_08850 [Cutibacterium granulosum]